jgi:kojibiose phosphorylase
MQDVTPSAFGELVGDDWQLTIDGFEPRHERAVESLLTVGNGYLGTRCSLPEGSTSSDAGTYIAGVYDHFAHPGPVPELIRTADWLVVQIRIGGELLSLETGTILEHRRTLYLGQGLVIRIWRQRDTAGRVTRVHFLHCASLADRHTMLQRIELTPENYSGQVSVDLLLDARMALRLEAARDFSGEVRLPFRPRAVAHLLPVTTSDELLMLRTAGAGITVAKATASICSGLGETARAAQAPAGGPQTGKRWEWMAACGQTYRLDKLVTVATSRDAPDPSEVACMRLEDVVRDGPDAILSAHKQAWASTWQTAGIDLAGDAGIQRALRLAAYHLASAAHPQDEHVSIGARGLTGEAYKGHVFWDTELFMLPFFVLTDPATARALLMYRYHTLPAARAKARRFGYRGALYAWESAAGGQEVAPLEVLGADDALIPIQSGAEEQHISADVAYAVWQYWRATRDEPFLLTAGAEILCETARFWASRAQTDDDMHFHIRGVVGPDEYHDGVDDNAYTNLLARWNLRCGLEVTALLRQRWPAEWRRLREHLHLSDREIDSWRAVAETLVDGLDPKTGVIEQFTGYSRLAEIDLAALEPRRVPIDVLLGHDRVRESQAIKQADVLMALYLLWEEYPIAVHAANFHYYEPRTAHGSSLSPGIHAAFAARLGELDLAQRYLRRTATLDLGDEMDNLAGGVHLAALGSLWQAAIFGFMGVDLHDDELQLRPRLPSNWSGLRCAFRWRGRSLALAVAGGPPSWSLSLTSGPPYGSPAATSRRLPSRPVRQLGRRAATRL